ncbi:hypothetical protein H9Q13_04695 [Pontibacter sp. JH31]|uniref:Uncharacterized protein n=1 Tax=Pontibacter aquaedesilientis TaxID=2766980 RepID=A0ABR7XDS7_9BACT|nr:hypothetical protein [Pontibacter aquaedesilientis]MBD1396453.1 hypothetical protein [Pontibacter aquaedesilientis]
MKHYLLLFLSTLLFLFTLTQPSKSVSGLACAIKNELKVADNYQKRKSPCAKKCLKHQTHSEQKSAANVTIDCGQQLYAVIADIQSKTLFKSGAGQPLITSVQDKHQDPHLGADPDPPRLS